MRKKVALTVAAAAMVGTLAVGGTLAWFTDTETATNVVTIGDVDIILEETGNGNVNGEGGLTYDDIMPNDQLEKDVDIKNVGTNDAYVRATITVTGTQQIIDDLLAQNNAAIKFTNLYEGGAWTEVDGAAVYVVEYDGTFANNDVWNLFDGIEIPNWGNAYDGADFNVEVTAEAIQAANFDTQADAIQAMSTVSDLDEGNNNDIVGTPSSANQN